VYVGSERVGDGWIQEDIVWDVRQVDILEGDSAIRSHVTWVSPHSEPFVEETATIRVHPLTDGFRLVDFEIELTALLDSVSLGGSEDEKGYGGFSARVRLPEDVAFTGPRGAIEPIETDVEAGPWVDISLGASGIAILQHPSNPGYPQPWILRRAGSMQNPSWPGREPVLLPKGAPLVLRYRIVVHEGGGVSLDELHERYAAWN
jgi:hypothetical protein